MHGVLCCLSHCVLPSLMSMFKETWKQATEKKKKGQTLNVLFPSHILWEVKWKQREM